MFSWYYVSWCSRKKIRKYLIDNNFVDCVIQLPSNLFLGTPNATCNMVLKNSKADNKVLFIDASAEFEKATNNNKLSDKNIIRIVENFSSRTDDPYFSRLVDYKEISEEQDYNLSVSTYVEQENTKEVIDIKELNSEIQKIVEREAVLRAEIDRIIREIEG